MTAMVIGHPVKDGELVHHSDSASQYTSTRLMQKLSLEDISASIGSAGDAHDNALIESANGLDKTECIRTTIFHHGPHKTIADVEYATAAWVDWCNCSRPHSSMGLVPPNEYESSYYAELVLEQSPTWEAAQNLG